MPTRLSDPSERLGSENVLLPVAAYRLLPTCLLGEALRHFALATTSPESMDRQVAPYLGSSLEAPAKDKLSYEPEHHDLLTFLAASQRLQLDFLPITWQPKLTPLGYGGTAGVSQSAVDVQTSFAYKRMYTEEGSSTNFMRLTAEAAALKSKSVVGHPNIVQLEGICWEIESKTDRVLPVLVSEKAELGDMRRFMATEDGRNVDMDTRIKWCLELAGALHSLHSGGKLSEDFD